MTQSTWCCSALTGAQLHPGLCTHRIDLAAASTTYVTQLLVSCSVDKEAACLLCCGYQLLQPQGLLLEPGFLQSALLSIISGLHSRLLHIILLLTGCFLS